MLVRIINPWTYQRVSFLPGDLVNMSDDLYLHTKEVSVAQPVVDERIQKIVDALRTDHLPSLELQEKLSYVDTPERVFFRVEGIQYAIYRDHYEIA